MKKILSFFLEPIKAFSNRQVAEKTANYYHKHPWIAYVIALIITVVLILLNYVLDIPVNL